MDVKLRDTTTPTGVAQKIELIAAEMRLQHFFPGEPQLALFVRGRVGRNDGFRPWMFQRSRAFAEKRSGMAHAEIDVAAAGGAKGKAAVRNLPELELVTTMEQWESMVGGLIAASKHVPEELGAGLGEFFSIQRTHCEKTAHKLRSMCWVKIYVDFLDRCDAHPLAVDRRALGVLQRVPAWDDLPCKLAAAMLAREDNIAEIAAELAAETNATASNAHAVVAVVAAEAAAAARQKTAEEKAQANKDKKERQKQAKEAKKQPADANKHKPLAKVTTTGIGAGGAPGGGAPGGGAAGSGASMACFSFVKNGHCSRGASCKFSHDPAVCANAANVQPAAAGQMWAHKWVNRAEPTRAIDPPTRVGGFTTIKYPWVLAEDRWTITEQCEGKCHKFHVKCVKNCTCALCQAAGG